MSPPDVCDLCKSQETNEITREMLRTPDRSVVAHYNCMLYSPKVTSIESQEEGFEFDIESVLEEIERGKKLSCTYCKNRGATTGCDVSACRRTYHYPCLIKDKGSVAKDKFVVYCFQHTKKKKDDGSEVLRKGKKRKKSQKSDGSSRKKKKKKRRHNSDTKNKKINELSVDNCVSPVRATVKVDDNEDVLLSTPGSISGPRSPSVSRINSASSSEESDSILTPRVTQAFSLSGFPKRKNKEHSSGKPNEKLEEILHTLTSEDKAALSQIYSELGGSHQNLIEVQDNTNGLNSTGFVQNGVVADTLICSETTNKTPERLTDVGLDMEAPGTPETHLPGCPVAEPESAVGTPPTTEEDGNEAEASCHGKGLFANYFGTPRNLTSEDEERQTKGGVCNIVSPQQIKAISRKLATGAFSKILQPVVQKIQTTIYSPKTNTTKNAGKNGHCEAVPDSCTEDQPVENYPHEYLQNQESSDDPIVSGEKSKSMASVKPFQDLLADASFQQTDENLPEQPEVSEEPNEYSFGENILLEEAATPRSVQFECATAHQSGPSRLTIQRRRLFSPFHRPTNPLGFQHEEVRVLDGIDGFGDAVAGQCRRLSLEKQAKYMSYVLATADLFNSHATLPELDILIANLRSTLQRSHQSSPDSGSSV